MAVRSALTGHLLLSTLHAGDAAAALFRLLEMGVPPYLLASSLIGIMAQRLVRRLCPYCREAYEVTANSTETAFLGEGAIGQILYRAVGCEKCYGTGYRGRLAIHEIMDFSEKIREAVLRRADIKTIRELAAEDGLINMAADGLDKARQGRTSLTEIWRVLYGGGMHNA